MLRHFLGSAFVVSFMLSLNFSKLAWAGGVDSTLTNGNSSPVSNNQSVSSTPSPSSNIPPPTNPPHYNDYDSYGSYSSHGSLNYPSCSGSCAFGIIRFTPGKIGRTHQEAVIGVITEFDSPNNKSAQAYQKFYQAQSNHIAQKDEVSLLVQIADAVKNCQDIHANMLALSAAKRLGLTPEQILSRAYKQRRNCNSSSNTAK